jgi:hypothetical protein
MNTLKATSDLILALFILFTNKLTMLARTLLSPVHIQAPQTNKHIACANISATHKPSNCLKNYLITNYHTEVLIISKQLLNLMDKTVPNVISLHQ